MNPNREIKLFAVVVSALIGVSQLGAGPINTPPSGKLYHGFYFSRDSDSEHNSNAKDVQRYEAAVGAGTTWVFFSDFWNEGRSFPSAMCRWILELGKVPYVRLMLRSEYAQEKPEKNFTLDAIVAGKFDGDLREWAAGARQFSGPLIVEWGTECNGEWFAWNGKWNGTSRGPERFILAWRHIVNLMRDAGCGNITWVWHVNDSDVPDAKWNRLENYYPGDDYVDWIAVSAYGFLKPNEKGNPGRLRDLLDAVVPRLQKLAPSKPVMLAEFGCAKHHSRISAADWAEDALTDIFAKRWPAVRGFCWWNERWENDENKKHDTDMVIMGDPGLEKVFRDQMTVAKERIQEKAILQKPPE